MLFRRCCSLVDAPRGQRGREATHVPNQHNVRNLGHKITIIHEKRDLQIFSQPEVPLEKKTSRIPYLEIQLHCICGLPPQWMNVFVSDLNLFSSFFVVSHPRSIYHRHNHFSSYTVIRHSNNSPTTIVRLSTYKIKINKLSKL